MQNSTPRFRYDSYSPLGLPNIEYHLPLHQEQGDANEKDVDRLTFTEINFDHASNDVSAILSLQSPSPQENGPFSIRNRIPIPPANSMSHYYSWLENTFLCKRNERERQRVRSVNDGFSRLRNHLPRYPQTKRRQSKVEILRHAISYIKQLQEMLEENQTSKENAHSQSKPWTMMP